MRWSQDSGREYATMKENPPGALTGMRVVEAGRHVWSAYCAKLLADLGAEVIKLVPPEPDRGLAIDDLHGVGGCELHANTSKHLVVLDVLDPQSAPDFERLLRDADVFIDDHLAGAAEGAVHAVAPHTIWCTITPFGRTGPRAGNRAHHLNTFHSGGEGYVVPLPAPGWPPLQAGGNVAHYEVGLNAAAAVVAAYLGRAHGGPGQRIDISAQEVLVAANVVPMTRYFYDGLVLRDGIRLYSDPMYRCRDGYITTTGGTREQFLKLAENPGAEPFADESILRLSPIERPNALRAILTTWCGQLLRDEAVRLLQEAGIPVGPVLWPGELLASPQLVHREFFQLVDRPGSGQVLLPGAPYRLSATPNRMTTPSSGNGHFSSKRQPAPQGEVGRPLLDGIRILDFSWAAAGPYATLLLAHLGAEVIKVENRRRPDPARRGFFMPPRDRVKPGEFPFGGIDSAPAFNALNLNKRSLELDLSEPGALDVIHELLESCAVVTSNFRPGVMERLGLSSNELLDKHPSLVVAASSANGTTGPEALMGGFAMIFSGMGGHSEQTGFADGPPTPLGDVSDFRSGCGFALAILAALVHRQHTGEGQVVDFSSRESVIACAPDAVIALAFGADPPRRLGNRHPTMVPHNVYPAADGRWLTIAVDTDQEWAALCSGIERLDLLESFPTRLVRKANEATIDAAVAPWVVSKDASSAADHLQSLGVAAMPVMSNADLAHDDHLRSRNMFVDVEHAEIGLQRVLRSPWLFSRSPARVSAAGPRFGEANEYVLSTLISGTEQQRNVLRRRDPADRPPDHVRSM